MSGNGTHPQPFSQIRYDHLKLRKKVAELEAALAASPPSSVDDVIRDLEAENERMEARIAENKMVLGRLRGYVPALARDLAEAKKELAKYEECGEPKAEGGI